MTFYGNQVREWIFTFGMGQKHALRFVRIVGTVDSSREEMFARFGTAWASQYPSVEAAGVEKFGLLELTRFDLDDWEKAPGVMH